MKQANRTKASALFLLELILAILFFSIASAVCVQIFVKAHLLSKDAQALQLAINECTGVAELINTSPDIDIMNERFGLVYPNATVENSSVIYIYYDQTFAPCTESEGLYKLTVVPGLTDNMLSANIRMTDLKNDKTVYELQVVHHIQQEVANES